MNGPLAPDRLVAIGTADITVEAAQAPWDYIPLVRIVAGAGGALVDWAGRELLLTPGAVKMDVVAVGDSRMVEPVSELLCG